jgi:hypothetical protein
MSAMFVKTMREYSLYSARCQQYREEQLWVEIGLKSPWKPKKSDDASFANEFQVVRQRAQSDVIDQEVDTLTFGELQHSDFDVRCFVIDAFDHRADVFELRDLLSEEEVTMGLMPAARQIRSAMMLTPPVPKYH